MMARLNSGETLVAGVVGRPVRHSLSPRIHSAWIAAADLDAAYVPFPVAESGFGRFVEGMRGGAVRGVNVTIPFKEEALYLADEADAVSRRAGSANVLVFDADGRIRAMNTDGSGMIEALAEAPRLDLMVAPAVVLGAGGAARAACAALAAAGVPGLRIVNRTRDRAAGLADAFSGVAHGWDDMAAAFAGAGVVVNATSAGLKGEHPLSGLPLDVLSPDAVVLDMVYSPLETALLRETRASGRTGIDGLSMLINQARPAFEAFYGAPAPAAVDVRALCLEVLEPRP